MRFDLITELIQLPLTPSRRTSPLAEAVRELMNIQQELMDEYNGSLVGRFDDSSDSAQRGPPHLAVLLDERGHLVQSISADLPLGRGGPPAACGQGFTPAVNRKIPKTQSAVTILNHLGKAAKKLLLKES